MDDRLIDIYVRFKGDNFWRFAKRVSVEHVHVFAQEAIYRREEVLSGILFRRRSEDGGNVLLNCFVRNESEQWVADTKQAYGMDEKTYRHRELNAVEMVHRVRGG